MFSRCVSMFVGGTLSCLKPSTSFRRLNFSDCNSQPRPKRPESVWHRYANDNRARLLSQRPELKRNDPEVWRILNNEFKRLDAAELRRLESERRLRLKEYYAELSARNSGTSGERTVDLLRRQVLTDKEKAKQAQRRASNRRKAAARAKRTDDPADRFPGGVFLDVFLKTRRRGEDEKWNAFVRRCADEWRELDAEGKRPFYEVYAQRVEDYRRRKRRIGVEAVDGDVAVTQRETHESLCAHDTRPDSDVEPFRPRRPRNPFIIYQSTFERAEGMTQSQFYRLTAAWWSGLSDLDKQPYVDASADEKRRYDNALRTWADEVKAAGRDPSVPWWLREKKTNWFRPFMTFKKTLERREGQSILDFGRECGEKWRSLDEDDKAVFRRIFEERDFDEALLEWRTYLKEKGDWK